MPKIDFSDMYYEKKYSIDERVIQTKIDLKIEEIRELVSRMGWENFDLMAQMNARLIELKELIKQEKTK